MKYGLRHEKNIQQDKDRMHLMEKDISHLKSDVYLLKEQLKNTLAFIFSNHNPSALPLQVNTINDAEGVYDQSRHAVIRNKSGKNVEPYQEKYNNLSLKKRVLQKTTEKPNCSFWLEGTITKKHYRASDQDGYIHCITTQKYNDSKSLEELRLEDYILKGFLAPSQNDPENRFKMARIDNSCSHTQPVKNNSLPFGGAMNDRKGLNESPLPLTDFNASFQSYISSNANQTGVQEKSFVEILERREEQLNLYLRDMNKSLTEINSKMSLMDSKLSAVDMFITMQRVDKGWQNLSSKLDNLEDSSFFKDSHKENKDQSSVIASLSSDTLLLNNSQVEKSFCKEEDVTMNSEISVDEEAFSETINSSGIMSLDLDESNQKVIPSNNKLEEVLPKHTDPHLKSETDENPVKEVKVKSIIPVVSYGKDYLDVEKTDCKIKQPNDTSTPSSGSTINNLTPSQVNIPQLNERCMENINKEDALLNPESVVINDKQVSDIDESLKNKEPTVTESDDDFVFVKKCDVPGCSDDSRPNCVDLSNNENPNIKVFSDITEYLEINLKKGKDTTYEFGFEVKPDTETANLNVDDSAHSEDQKSKKNSSTNSNADSSKDDSFGAFINKFLSDKAIPSQSTQKKIEKKSYLKKSTLKQHLSLPGSPRLTPTPSSSWPQRSEIHVSRPWSAPAYMRGSSPPPDSP